MLFAAALQLHRWSLCQSSMLGRASSGCSSPKWRTSWWPCVRSPLKRSRLERRTVTTSSSSSSGRRSWNSVRSRRQAWSGKCFSQFLATNGRCCRQSVGTAILYCTAMKCNALRCKTIHCNVLLKMNAPLQISVNPLTAAIRDPAKFLCVKWRQCPVWLECYLQNGAVIRGPARTLPAKWRRYPDARIYTV